MNVFRTSVVLATMCIAAPVVADSDDHERARVAFSADQGVIDEIVSFQDRSYSRLGYAVPALISGSCGIVGCSKTFLVIQEMGTEGANPQYSAVTRLVTIPAAALDEKISLAPFPCKE